MAQETKQEKVKRAGHLLLFRRGRRPGARDWELRQRLGKDWELHVKDLNDSLAPLDLEVKRIEEPALAEGAEPPIRYLTVLKGTMTPTDARMAGWRVDHLAGLAVALGFILAKQGRAPRDEVEDLLATKLGRWRSSTALDSYVRSGYLREDDDGLLAPDWRTTAEVDVRQLMGRLLAMKAEAPSDDARRDEDDEDIDLDDE
ncbi:MAG TPA: hypothetical protein VGR28_03390 [Candidatus Thermoplasmatota archaeon]|jgi:hypothetical protein|nr:hypothetical protein [Candidatus Thermoplasmatota archaeon]